MTDGQQTSNTKKNNSFKKEIIIILVVGLIVNVACFFMDTLYPKAASSSSGNEYFPMEQNYFNFDVYSYINSKDSQIHWTQNANYYHAIASHRQYDANGNAGTLFIVVVYSDSPIKAYYNQPQNFYLENIGVGGFYEVYEITAYSNGTITVNNRNGWVNNNHRLTNNYTSSVATANTRDKYSYLSNLAIEFNNADFLCLNYVVLPNSTQFNDAPQITGHALPTQPTAPTFTPPTYDSSLSLVENVKSFIQWLGQYIGTLFTWLLQSIYDYLDNLLQNLKAFINAVITAINNGFMNIYNNINSLFYPFITFFTAFAQVIEDFLENFSTDFIAFVKQQLNNLVSGISNLVDSVITIKNFLTGTQGFFETYGVIWNQQTWEDALDDSPWLDAVSDNTTTMSQFINGTLNVAEPQELTFTMDFRNAHYNFGLVTWDLSWYQPYKQSVRLAFLAICVLNALVYFFDEAPNFFSGGGSNKKGDK